MKIIAITVHSLVLSAALAVALTLMFDRSQMPLYLLRYITCGLMGALMNHSYHEIRRWLRE